MQIAKSLGCGTGELSLFNDLSLSKTKIYGLNFPSKPHEGRMCLTQLFLGGRGAIILTKTFIK